LSSAATLTGSGQTTVIRLGEANLTSSAALNASAFRIVGPVEPYQFDDYSWDTTGTWEIWPENVWGPDGFTARMRSSIIPNGGILREGSASLASTATVTATGARIYDISRQLDSTATVTNLAGLLQSAQSSMATTATLYANGGLVLGATSTINAAFATSASAVRIFDPGADLNSNFAVGTDQSGVNGAFGVIRFIGDTLSVGAIATTSAFSVAIRPASATLSAFDTVVTILTLRPIDPDRTILVKSESRHIDVLEETRTWKIEPEARMIRVVVMPKIGTTNRRELV